MRDLLDDLPRTDIESMTNSIYRSAKAAFNLLDNLLTWSRLQQGRIKYKPCPIELHQLADNSLDLLGDMALGKEIRLKNAIEAERSSGRI